jgi:hypothetical protein
VEKILENLWGVFVGLGWWMLNRLTSKIDNLESSKAEQSAVAEQQKEIKCLDKRVDEIDHATQLRLVPRDEYKYDISALHTRVNILSEQLGRKQDTIKTIRIEKEKGK